jgi:hypothetical protein
MIAPSEGTVNDKGNEFTFISNFIDPMTSKPASMKMIMRFESADRHVIDFFELGEGGKERQQMQLTYTRKVAKKKAPKERKPKKEKTSKKAAAK